VLPGEPPVVRADPVALAQLAVGDAGLPVAIAVAACP
jgi:hypothetical protein